MVLSHWARIAKNDSVGDISTSRNLLADNHIVAAIVERVRVLLVASPVGLAATLVSVLELDGSGTNGEECGDEAAHCRSLFL